MAAVHASLLAKDINNNILAALPVEKMSAQALYNQRSVVQPGLISDPEEEVQHLIRFVALDGRTKPGGTVVVLPRWRHAARCGGLRPHQSLRYHIAFRRCQSGRAELGQGGSFRRH